MDQKNLPVYVWLPILLVAAGLATLAMLNKTVLQDWLYFRSYTAPSEITAISQRGKFSAEGQRLFERADPSFVADAEIGSVCLGVDNLGCVVDGPKIYLADFEGVSDEEKDLQMVTSAHELLHIAYSRLSDDERQRIDDLVTISLNMPSNSALRDSIRQAYSDPEVAADEAHSQLATEASVIAPSLNSHFAQFFTDREAIVAAHKNSQTLLQQRR